MEPGNPGSSPQFQTPARDPDPIDRGVRTRLPRATIGYEKAIFVLFPGRGGFIACPPSLHPLGKETLGSEGHGRSHPGIARAA